MDFRKGFTIDKFSLVRKDSSIFSDGRRKYNLCKRNGKASFRK